MKKFIIKTLVFILSFICLLAGVVLINRYFSRFRIDAGKTMIFAGHSHSECAYNDSLIAGSVNLSESGESYFYTYYKLKKVIRQNPQISRIFIEFSNNQVDSKMDSWIWDDKYMINYLPRYALLIDREGLKLLYRKNPACLMHCIRLMLKNNFTMLFRGLNYSHDIGGYRYLVRDKTDSLLHNLPVHPDKKLQAVSSENLQYLQHIIDLCKQRDIDVVLVRSPMHEKSATLANEAEFQEIRSKMFADIDLLDFSQLPLKDSDFGDLEHLNHRGARIFSLWFSGLIEKNLFLTPDKHLFVEKQINAIAQSN